MLTASCTQGSPSRCEENYSNGEEKSGFQESVLVRTTSKDINVCDLRHNRLSSRRSFPVAVINGGLKKQVEVPPRYFDDTGHCRMISHIDFTSPLSPFFSLSPSRSMKISLCSAYFLQAAYDAKSMQFSEHLN